MNSRTDNKKKILTYWFLRIPAAVALAAVITAGFAGCAPQHKTFAAGQQGVDAFIKAMREDNNKELLAIFGGDAKELIFSGDPVADRQRREMFINAYDEQHRLNAEEGKLILSIGKNDWPFPIPLIQQRQQWIFDTAAGKEEILNRRIGLNELNTIQVILAIVDAQREYAIKDRDGDGLLEYAQKFNSDPARQNGLYWPTTEGQEPSPLGPLVAQAKKEGYSKKESGEKPIPYYGYYYRILTAQGANADGGAFDYIVNGNMIGGVGVIAWPAEYGNSGVMTFIVNHDGVVYQKNLGEDTEQAAAKLQLFDPDQTWTKVEQ